MILVPLVNFNSFSAGKHCKVALLCSPHMSDLSCNASLRCALKVECVASGLSSVAHGNAFPNSLITAVKIESLHNDIFLGLKINL